MGGSAHATVYLQVEVNQAPNVIDDRTEVAQGESISVNLLDNDSDPEGDSLTLIDVAHNNVQFTPDGTARFTPAIDFTGELTVSYRVSDAFGNISDGQWHIQVKPAGELAVRNHGGGSMNWLYLMALLLLRVATSGLRRKEK